MNITERVKLLGLPLGQYVVVASGILEALGIRKASDADIAVLPELYAKLKATGEWDEFVEYGKTFLQKENTTIIPSLEWDKFPITAEQAINSATIIDGVPFMNLDMLRQFKLALGREKDFADIKLIDQYSENNLNK